MADVPVTITYDTSKHTYQMTPESPKIGLDDTLTITVQDKDCCICFKPASYFGRRLRLTTGTHGPYAPADNAPPPPPEVKVNYCITDFNLTCKPDTTIDTTYSIKVG